jgi:hypothetical protein
MQRGAVALEFAVLAVPFLLLVLGAMEIGYDYFVQAALDNAVNLAARGVQVGAQQIANGESGADFVKTSVCPALGGLLNCDQLYVAVTPISAGTGTDYYDYLSANPPSLANVTGTGGGAVGGADPVHTGNGCQVMILEAYYLGPTFLGTLIPSFSVVSPLPGAGGRLVHVTYSGAGFINENFGGSAGC